MYRVRVKDVLKEELEMVTLKPQIIAHVLKLTRCPSGCDVLFPRANVPLPRRPRGQDGLAGLADRDPVEVRVTHEVL